MTAPPSAARRHDTVRGFGAFARFFTAYPLNSREISAMEGVRAALVIAAPVAAAQLLGQPGLMWAAVAAFWTCLADPDGPILWRMTVLSTYTVVGALTCVVASTAYSVGPAWVLPLTFLWTLAGAFALAYGSAWSLAGTLITCVFLAASERPPAGNGGAIGMGALFIEGGVWAATVSVLLWRIQPYFPMRNAVWAAYRSFADFVREMVGLAAAPGYDAAAWESHDRSSRRSFRAAIEAARSAIEPVPRLLGPASREGDRLLLLVETADQLLGRVAALSDTLDRTREKDGDPLPEALQQALRRLNVAAIAFAESFTATGKHRERRLRQTERFVDALANAIPARRLSGGRHIDEASLALAAIVDRLRTGLTLARERDMPDAALTTALPQKGRSTGRRALFINPLRDNLSLQSPILRHALRRAVTVTAATALVLALRLPYGYWLTMSTALVLQPYVASTWQRSVERGAGSAFGGALGAIAGFFLNAPLERLALIVPLAVGTMAFRAVNYGVYISCLTPLFVLVADLGHPGAKNALQFAEWRVSHSIVGSGIGLLGGLLLWPSWEAGRLSEQIAAAIEAVGNYARCVFQCSSERTPPEHIAAAEVARRAAGLASSAAESSLQQLVLEPRKIVSVNTDAAMAILAALRRVAGTATTVYLLGETAPAPEGDPMHTPSVALEDDKSFAKWVDVTARTLAAAARERRAPGLWHPWTGVHTDALSARIERQLELVHGALSELCTHASHPPAPSALTPPTPSLIRMKEGVGG